MADKPIIFSAPMVRAILAGTKTQTRRIQKNAPEGDGWHCDQGAVGLRWVASAGAPSMPVILRWQVGDRLWVRETWSGIHAFHDVKPSERQSFVGDGYPYLREEIWHWADGDPLGGDWERPRPAIHMPRWASRITLAVTNVRIERLLSISEDDARAEGFAASRPRDIGGGLTIESPGIYASAGGMFQLAWKKLHPEWDGWSDPWVCALTFRRVAT